MVNNIFPISPVNDIDSQRRIALARVYRLLLEFAAHAKLENETTSNDDLGRETLSVVKIPAQEGHDNSSFEGWLRP